MANGINNLEELKREKELLRLKMKITGQAFLTSLGQNRRQVQRLVINKIALPVGAGALTSWLVQVLARRTKEDVEIMGEMMPEEEQSASHWWVPIVRTLMRFLETYLDQIEPLPSSHSENGHAVNPVVRKEKDG